MKYILDTQYRHGIRYVAQVQMLGLWYSYRYRACCKGTGIRYTGLGW